MTNGKVITQTTAGSHKDHSAKRWWQWVLMYPGMLIFILSSIPTWYQLVLSYRHKVAFSEAFDATKQEKYWKRNLEEMDNKKFQNSYVQKDGYIYEVRVFSSGDLLAVAFKNDSIASIRWVGYEMLRPRLSSLSMIGEAYAADMVPGYQQVDQNKTILCTRQLSGNRVLMRVMYGPSNCYDEIIEMGSGTVVQRNKATCNSDCG